MNSIDTKIVTLKVEYDTDTEDPLESNDGMWTPHDERDVERNFTDRGDRHAYKMLPDTLDLFFKLRTGLAFVVGGSQDNYGYSGLYPTEYDPGERIRRYMTWDHPEGDMGAKTVEERKKDAKGTLDEYNKWCGGECYGFIWNDGEPDEDSCWGFIGEEYFKEAVRDDYFPTADRPVLVVLDGELAVGMFETFDFGEGVEVMTRKEYRQFERDEETAEGEDAFDYDRLEVTA